MKQNCRPVAVLLAVAVPLGAAQLACGEGGSIVGWGSMAVVPDEELTELVAVSAGTYHSLGVRADGSIAAWGLNDYGQDNVPAPNADFVGVAAGYHHSLGLKSDGSIVAWGRNDASQCDVPEPNAGFVAVAGGPFTVSGRSPTGPL